MADDEKKTDGVLEEFATTILGMLVREVRLEDGDGHDVHLGPVTFARLDPATLILRVGLGQGTFLALHPDWSGIRKLATTAKRVSSHHNARDVLELLRDEDDVEVH
jgi:hypothetical protein